MKNDFHIFIGAAERLKSLKLPDQLEKISVIPTPFELEGTPVLLGKRSQGQLLALFPCTPQVQDLVTGPLRLANGFEIALSELQVVGKSALSKFIELRNAKNIDLILFGAVLDEVFTNLENSPTDVLSIIKNVLERWKAMLSLDSERILSMQALIGLVGEIKLLVHLISRDNGQSFMNWVGPQGNRHDFEFDFSSIEVKSTTIRTRNEITIHGLHQLDPYPGKTVYIFIVRMELDPAGVSLPELIDEILKLRTVPEVDLFEKLSKVGYRHGQKSSYESIRFQFTEFRLLPIDSRFPRISRVALSQVDAEERIMDIQYSVETSGFEIQKSNFISEINFEGLI